MKTSHPQQFWDRAADLDPAWYSATRPPALDAAFWESGRRDVDDFLEMAGVRLAAAATALEIGTGAGRTTKRLAQRFAAVTAIDVSPKMMDLARINLIQFPSVKFRLVEGAGDIPFESNSFDLVFSYLTMQHIPSKNFQLNYLSEAIRVTRPGGWVVMQFTKSGRRESVLAWRAHLFHFLSGRRSLNVAWRGAGVSEEDLRGRRVDGVRLDVLRHGGRQLWAIARKT